MATAIFNTGDMHRWCVSSGASHSCVPVKVLAHRLIEKGWFGETVEWDRTRNKPGVKGGCWKFPAEILSDRVEVEMGSLHERWPCIIVQMLQGLQVRMFY